ncbi:unnamed protein product, partial [Mesorhabditis belari]|uniref:Uncharacterized protein n=1 Tax=Mesorhabditis belari TaxID=2138241 RepID=A0AAF3J6W6_9BILA
MDVQEAQQNRQAREIAYGQCYERSPWKSLYLRKKRIISNWRSRAIQSSTVLKDDIKQFIGLQIHPGRIITRSHDLYTFRVWNVEDAEPAFTLTGQNGLPWSHQVSEDGQCIVSGGQDGTVRVWCGQTGAQLHVLQGHTQGIPCMSLHGTTLVSGSYDETLRVWDIVDGKCLHILAGHLAWLNFCVQFDGKRVVFVGRYCTVWHVHTGECLQMLTGHRDIIFSLLFESQRDLVVSGSRDRTIRVWDVQRGTCIAHLDLLQELMFEGYGCGMQLRGNILACYYGSDVWVWDIREGGSCIHHLHGVNGHTSTITSLQWLESGLLATGSCDGLVKLWDLDQGIFVRDLIRLPLQRIAIVHQITGFLLRNSEIDFRDFRRQQFVLNAELIPLFVDFDDVVKKGNGGDDTKTATQIYRSMIYEFLAVGANETQLSTLRDLDQVHDRGQLSVHLLDDFLSRL